MVDEQAERARTRGRSLRLTALSLVVLVSLAGATWFWQVAQAKREQEQREAAIAEQGRQAEELRRQQELEEVRRAAAAKSTLEKLYLRWQDAERLALSTPFLALSGPVATLQSLRREAEDIDVPPCLLVARAKLAGGMKRTVDGFLSGMGDSRLAGVMVYFARQEAVKDFTFFGSALSGCRERSSGADPVESAS